MYPSNSMAEMDPAASCCRYRSIFRPCLRTNSFPSAFADATSSLSPSFASVAPSSFSRSMKSCHLGMDSPSRRLVPLRTNREIDRLEHVLELVLMVGKGPGARLEPIPHMGFEHLSAAADLV